jgi:hypothetical protein
MIYIINYFKHFISCFTACVLNQSRGYWLLNDALHVAISMSFKLKEGMNLFLLTQMMNNIAIWTSHFWDSRKYQWTYKRFCKSRNVDISKISSEYKKHQMPFGVVEEIEFVFPIVGFLVQQILRIINFQIKIKRIFFVIGILTNLRKCSL